MPGPPVLTIKAELKDVLASALGSLSRLNDLRIEQAQHPDYTGLATVYRQASKYAPVFKGFRVHHLDKVRNMPVGTSVLCLPMTAADCGWRAVITNVTHENQKLARFAWVHPECLRAMPTLGARPRIEVHHTKKRGYREASIDIGPEEIGVRPLNGRLVLDARWGWSLGGSHECTGHCFALCESLASQDEAFAIVLHFAETMREHDVGLICCDRGKHRSVAAANLLERCFGLSVNMDHAARERCYQCCHQPMFDNMPGIFQALRRLPMLADVDCRLLSDVLRLPV